MTFANSEKDVLLCSRKVLGRMLTKRGCIVTAVDSGEAMLGAILGSSGGASSAPLKTFSAVLVDRYMPGAGGPSAIK